MKRFYKVDDLVFLEIDFVETIQQWQAYLINIRVHKTTSRLVNADKIKLINDIISNNWFKSNTDNFSVFIEDILKY